MNKKYNQNQQAELGKLSSFLKKHSKKPPFHPIRCGWRYVKKENVHMPLILSILLMSLCFHVNSTEQTPDVFIEGEAKYEVLTEWSYASPLETYFLNENIKSPFLGVSTGNYRGHIGYWALNNEKLYLVKIMVQGDGKDVEGEFGFFVEESKEYELSSLFKNGVNQIGKFASWHTGSLLLKVGAYKKDFENGTYAIQHKEFKILSFVNGVLTESHSFKREEYWNAVKQVFADDNKSLSSDATIIKNYYEAQSYHE